MGDVLQRGDHVFVVRAAPGLDRFKQRDADRVVAAVRAVVHRGSASHGAVVLPGHRGQHHGERNVLGER
jgi:hypothetical protein